MRKDVTVTLFGLGRSHAVYREGMGCYLDHGGVAADVSLPAVFAEPEKPPFRRTRAVVVVKDGHVVAERYAEGYGVETPLLGFSATKSVISALTGILIRKGALTLDQPVPIAAWQGAGSQARHHGQSSAAPYRRPCDREFARGLAWCGVRAGQSHEIHGIRYGGLCRKH
jgi:hypothetical protein